MFIRYWRLILFVLVIVGLIGGVFWLVNKFILNGKWRVGEIKTYQVLVSVYDEKNSDPIEDKKSSMKKGYVIGVYDENHEWSDTEKFSYLILKIKLNEKEVVKIIEPVKENIDKKNLTLEQKKMLEEDKNPESQKKIVAVRKYKINLEKIKFSDPNSLLSGQPYLDKVFDWSIVMKVE